MRRTADGRAHSSKPSRSNIAGNPMKLDAGDSGPVERGARG